MKQYTCWCYECLKDMKEDGWPIPLTRMILCPDCGNKRCPKATNHTLECTNSNDYGQPGSRYSDDYVEPEYQSMLIAPSFIEPDPIVVLDKNSKEIFKITKDGDVYYHGRLVKGDEELIQATKEFMNRMLGKL